MISGSYYMCVHVNKPTAGVCIKCHTKGNDLRLDGSEATTQATITSSTPVPTTILEAIVNRFEYETTRSYMNVDSRTRKAVKTRALTEIETYYTTRLKKCIGEEVDHYSRTAIESLNTEEKGVRFRQEFRAEILSKWLEEV